MVDFTYEPLTPDELVIRYSGEAERILRKGPDPLAISQVWVSQKGVGPNQVLGKVSADSDFVPPVGRLGLKEKVREYFVARGKYVGNEPMARVTGLAGSGEVREPLTISFQRGYYLDYLNTNCSMDLQHTDESQPPRAYLEPGPHLSKLSEAKCENHLGVSAIYETDDGNVLLPLRSDKVVTSSGQYGPSVSAGMMFADQRGGAPHPFEAILRETQDELGVQSDDIDDVRMVGICRELARGGKPEAFFVGSLKCSLAEVQANLPRAKDAFEVAPSDGDQTRPAIIALSAKDYDGVRGLCSDARVSLIGKVALWYYLLSRGESPIGPLSHLSYE